MSGGEVRAHFLGGPRDGEMMAVADEAEIKLPAYPRYDDGSAIVTHSIVRYRRLSEPRSDGSWSFAYVGTDR